MARARTPQPLRQLRETLKAVQAARLKEAAGQDVGNDAIHDLLVRLQADAEAALRYMQLQVNLTPGKRDHLDKHLKAVQSEHDLLSELVETPHECRGKDPHCAKEHQRAVELLVKLGPLYHTLEP